MRDGAIVGWGGALCSTRNYADFELRFKVKLKDGVGTSGVQFRSGIADRARWVTTGPQCEIAEASHPFAPGSLVTKPNGPTIAAPRDRIAEVYKFDDFNEFSIRCVGQHVTIRVNGVIAVDADWPTMPKEGIIAWQSAVGATPLPRGTTPREVVFKDVALVDLTTGPAK